MAKDQELIGKKFGRLTVLDVFRTEKGAKQCHCRCSCGREKDFSEDVLLHGNTVSCGHVREEMARNFIKICISSKTALSNF